MPIEEMKPNAARMWDYVMGGTHNFVVDREAVKLTRKAYPIYEESLIQQRRFLQRAMTYMAKEKGLDKFIDFGSGLPTQGNVHEIVQGINRKAKVIYSDKDPIAVIFGQEILGKSPNVRYISCDVEEPHTLLDSPEAAESFGDDRRVGIGLVGVFLYVADEPLAQFFNTLYQWADNGSHIAVTCARKKLSEDEEVVQSSKKIGVTFYAHTAQEILDIIGPWKLTEPGLVPGLYWGLPEGALEINEAIKEYSYCFVAYK